MDDEHVFPPTGFAVAWFSCTYFAFVICKEFVVVVFFFLPSLFCHLQDWMVSLWMHYVSENEYWIGMIGLSDHLTCPKPNCIGSVQLLYFEHISHTSNHSKVK